MKDYHWKELIPGDRYRARGSGILHEYDRKLVTMLYQPLLGTAALGLYMTLWAELEQDRLWGKEHTHHRLMTLTQMNLKSFYSERIKLEGIGLLTTFVQEADDARSFIYELQAPLKPLEFFNDGMLNIYLYNRVGHTTYMQLKRYFIDEERKTAENVTRSFDEVFQSLQPSEMSIQSEEGPGFANEYIGEAPASEPKLSEAVFDFELLFEGLSESVVSKKSITEPVKETIVKLSYVYGIDPLNMQNLLMDSLLPNETIDTELLRKCARDWYDFQYGKKTPKLIEMNKIQPVMKRTVPEDSELTKEQMIIRQLETISPYQFMKDLYEGVEPTLADMQIIEEVMIQQKLLPGVANVLIYYVMLKSDMKLSKGYVQRIAGHWARKKITTVEEAMELAKTENKKYLEWAEAKSKPASNRRKPIRSEIVPDWLKEQEKGQNAAGEQPEAKSDADLEAEKEKIAEWIKNFKNPST
ncbi:Replication initiation and membrane attachment protein [Bacillus sp. FJAT-42376]|uniref:replication initiation and membrane attachment family protein n=1 Tax=Bacillus sp. FJAT-42376 TaxID=2014076 RepID=UPI000F50802B|nr:DnaD domain protein [Bacillus sp. FJAT-42376]AZB43887.1 Replication initiation and membrane attachment protein [Bacillus sp. FJAT-42376]